VTLALASAAFYGAGDFLGGIASKRADAVVVTFIAQAAGLVVLALLLPLLPSSSPVPSDYLWGVAAGVSGSGGVALLYRALAIGTMSVVAPITAVVAVALPVVISVVLGERPRGLPLLGILLGIAAIVLVSRPTVQPSDSPAARRSGVGHAFLAGIGVALFLLTLAQTRREAGLWPLLTDRIASVAFFAIVIVVSRGSVRLPKNPTALALAGGSLDMIANALYLLAVRIGPFSPVVTLSALYPAGTVLLARAILGERLSWWQAAGIVCALIAVTMIVGG